MSDNSFKVGDVVQLKSGGPWMTIVLIDSERDEISCSWFPLIDSEKPSWVQFPRESLHLSQEQI